MIQAQLDQRLYNLCGGVQGFEKIFLGNFTDPAVSNSPHRFYDTLESFASFNRDSQ